MMDILQELRGLKEKKLPQRKEWLGVEIKPVRADEVRGLAENMYQSVLGFDDYAYTTSRGVKAVLETDSWDYAKLPDFGHTSAMEVIRSMAPGSSWLDLGCGQGVLIYEVLEDIKPGLDAVGYDARTWGEPEDRPEIPQTIYGDIDQVLPTDFPGHEKGFDLITSSSVFYHLPDFWGALLRASRLQRKDGFLFISTINRPLKFGEDPVEDQQGNFTVDPKEYEVKYYRNRNMFDAKGDLITLGEAVRRISLFNPDYNLEYHPGPMEDASGGNLCYGGGFSGQRTSEYGNLDLSCVFYCQYKYENYRHRELKFDLVDLSFLVASTKDEMDQLKAQGYVSVQDRIDLETVRQNLLQ